MSRRCPSERGRPLTRRIAASGAGLHAGRIRTFVRQEGAFDE